MTTLYHASITIYANTYKEAILRAGEHMDRIWGNGNWSLANCHARPRISNELGPIGWEWEMEIVWHGLGPR